MKLTKAERRQRIKRRIRKVIQGTTERPRLSVYKSNKGIYCQIIDDLTGSTLVSASSSEKGFDFEGNKTDQAKKVGEIIAQRAKDKNVEDIIFDRSGYRFHGRVKALAEAAREGGLKF